MSTQASRAWIVAVGDELLAGAHPDLNSPWLAARLAERGFCVERVTVVGDDELEIAAVVRSAAERARLILVSGGLGPTLDDVTRHAVARAIGRALVRSDEAWAGVRAWYERSGRTLPASNERQALVPEGAKVLDNPAGTAPAFHATLGASEIFVFPGPPRELQVTADRHLFPWLACNAPPGARAVRRFFLFDLAESLFADRAGAWMERSANPLMGVTAKDGVLSVSLVASAPTAAAAEGLLAARGAEFLERFGSHIFSEVTSDLALVTGAEILARGLSVSLAESCTAGLIAAALTRTPGFSARFSEAFVTYSDSAKRERLGVSGALLERHGAVSPEVALAMARGAAERAGARLALAVTGIAGPGGGSSAKPVGLVWFGVVRDGEEVATARRWPDAGRDAVRAWATTKALSLLWHAARGEPLASFAAQA